MTPPRPRVLRLPREGTLLVSTDLHGNLDDLERLCELFLEQCACDPQTHWVLLGDAVHGPTPQAARDMRWLYNYPDRSWEVVQRILELQATHPGRVHYVLGNHDHGHVGGPHTHKFHRDEVVALEDRLNDDQRRRLRGLFEQAFLLAIAPCGVLLSHGSPDDSLQQLGDVDAIELQEWRNDAYHLRILDGLLRAYGQPEAVTIRLLAQLSTEVGSWLHRRADERAGQLGLVIHGHDRDPEGWFADGQHQLCPVLFGATRSRKRYLRLDLSATYRSTAEIRLDTELLCLHPRVEGRTLTPIPAGWGS